MRTNSVLVTSFGTVEAPPHLTAAMNMAPKRRNGRPDRRFTASRDALRIEAEAIRESEEELLNDPEFYRELEWFGARL